MIMVGVIWLLSLALAMCLLGVTFLNGVARRKFNNEFENSFLKLIAVVGILVAAALIALNLNYDWVALLVIIELCWFIFLSIKAHDAFYLEQQTQKAIKRATTPIE